MYNKKIIYKNDIDPIFNINKQINFNGTYIVALFLNQYNDDEESICKFQCLGLDVEKINYENPNHKYTHVYIVPNETDKNYYDCGYYNVISNLDHITVTDDDIIDLELKYIGDEEDVTILTSRPTKRKRTSTTTFQKNSSKHSKPTSYKNVNFRSQLEARTALLMDLLDIPWEYEMAKFKLSEGKFYTIDFYLPKQHLFIEIKPFFPSLPEIIKCQQLSQKGFDVVLLYGSVGLPFSEEERDGSCCNFQRGIQWSNGNLLTGFNVWNYNDDHGFLDLVTDFENIDSNWKHDEIIKSMEQINNYKFEE